MSEVAKKHSHYFKEMPAPDVDVYRVLLAFNVTDPCIQHAVKKILVAGARGAGKDINRDVQEAIDTLERWKEMRAEESVPRSPWGQSLASPVGPSQHHLSVQTAVNGVWPLCMQKGGPREGSTHACYPPGTCYAKGCVNERAQQINERAEAEREKQRHRGGGG